MALIGQDSRNECFRNNLFVCRMLDDFYSEQDLLDLDIDRTTNPFMIYNITVARERPPAWHSGGLPHLKSKLVFQEYRFGRSGPNAKRNVVAVETEPGERVEWFEPIVTIGHLPSNDVVLPDNTVSRRHCLIINYPDDVWLHDLGSTRGTIVDGQEVRDSMFLNSLHEVQVGPKARLSVAANVERLV